MQRFGRETLLEIRDWIREQLATAPGERATVEVPDPDLGQRGLRSWVELAGSLGCRLRTPRPVAGGVVALCFEPLDPDDSFHDHEPEDATEKYGVASRYARLDKLEEPGFVLPLEAALRRLDLSAGARVLDLGVNTGDELELLRRIYGEERFASFELVGVDHSASAIARARERFPGAGRRFHGHDLNALTELDAQLGPAPFDLLMSVATLHSPGIADSQALLHGLVRDRVGPGGAVILGFPNGRWRGGELLPGAQAKNYAYPELSLVLKDLSAAKRYLQQQRFRVEITGSSYLFILATRLGQAGAGQ